VSLPALQLKYLSAVINESMRMYPAVPSGTIRITDRPINLGGHQLPAGQPVMMPFWAIHRSPRLWTDPDSFKPERFLPAEASSALLAAAAVGTQGEQQSTAGAAAAVGAGGSSEARSPGGFSTEGSVSSTTATAGVPNTTGGAGQGGSKVEVSEGLLDAGDGDEDYVDVAADIAAMRDQEQRAATADQQQQELKQREPLSASSNSSSSSSSSGKASRDAAETIAQLDVCSSVPRPHNLELKVCSCCTGQPPNLKPCTAKCMPFTSIHVWLVWDSCCSDGGTGALCHVCLHALCTRMQM